MYSGSFKNNTNTKFGMWIPFQSLSNITSLSYNDLVWTEVSYGVKRVKGAHIPNLAIVFGIKYSNLFHHLDIPTLPTDSYFV